MNNQIFIAVLGSITGLFSVYVIKLIPDHKTRFIYRLGMVLAQTNIALSVGLLGVLIISGVIK